MSAPSADRPRRGDRKQGLDDALLDAAETLIGRHGPDGVSLRQIAAAAGSSNHFAVQYYFKDKEGLIRAIIERRLRSLEARRSELLKQVIGVGREREPRALLDVLFLPIAEETDAEGRRSYAAFLFGMRVFSDFWAHWEDVAASGPLTRNVGDLLRSSLKWLPDDLFYERIQAANTLFLAAIADGERQEAVKPRYRQSKGALSRALDFAAAGLTAPS